VRILSHLSRPWSEDGEDDVVDILLDFFRDALPSGQILFFEGITPGEEQVLFTNDAEFEHNAGYATGFVLAVLQLDKDESAEQATAAAREQLRGILEADLCRADRQRMLPFPS
jgi:hypothetical protein